MFAYTLFEVRRTLRNPRFLLLVAAVPVLLYVVSVNNARHGSTPLGASAATWYLASAAVIGVLGGALTGANARLAAERASGWYRQLRTTPLGDGAGSWAASSPDSWSLSRSWFSSPASRSPGEESVYPSPPGSPSS